WDSVLLEEILGDSAGANTTVQPMAILSQQSSVWNAADVFFDFRQQKEERREIAPLTLQHQAQANSNTHGIIEQSLQSLGISTDRDRRGEIQTKVVNLIQMGCQGNGWRFAIPGYCDDQVMVGHHFQAGNAHCPYNAFD